MRGLVRPADHVQRVVGRACCDGVVMRVIPRVRWLLLGGGCCYGVAAAVSEVAAAMGRLLPSVRWLLLLGWLLP